MIEQHLPRSTGKKKLGSASPAGAKLQGFLGEKRGLTSSGLTSEASGATRGVVPRHPAPPDECDRGINEESDPSPFSCLFSYQVHFDPG